MLTSSGQYPSAALPFILADRLFINAPPSSQSPSLCLSSSIIPQLFLSLVLPPLCSLLCLSSRPHLFSLLPLQFILPSLYCITFHNHNAFSRFSYSGSLRETYVPLFSASFNLYLPSGCFAALSSPHTCTFTNHSWEKLWCNHGPVLLSSCDGAMKPSPNVVGVMKWCIQRVCDTQKKGNLKSGWQR